MEEEYNMEYEEYESKDMEGERRVHRITKWVKAPWKFLTRLGRPIRSEDSTNSPDWM